MSHNNRSHGKQKIIAYNRARRDRNFKQNFSKMKEAQMVKYQEVVTVCPQCGCVRNPDNYILDKVSSLYVAQQRGATVKMCQYCVALNIKRGGS